MFCAIFFAFISPTRLGLQLGKQKNTRKIHLSYISRTFHLSRRRCLKDLVFLLFKSPFKAFGLRKRHPFCRFHPFPLSFLDPKSNSLLRTTPAARNARSYRDNAVQPTIRFAPPENERIRPTKKKGPFPMETNHLPTFDYQKIYTISFGGSIPQKMKSHKLCKVERLSGTCR